MVYGAVMLEQADRPMIVGVAGGTGSGKTTVARRLAEALPTERVAVIEHDHYYRDNSHLSPEERAKLNYDHPEALETELMAEHLATLRSGRAVEVPIYDFVTHTRTRSTRRVEPAPVIIVEGILVFVEQAVRELLDVKIFVDTDADLRVLRRIRRDIEQRGRSFASFVSNAKPAA